MLLKKQKAITEVTAFKGMGETFTKGEFRNHFKAEYSQPSPSHRINSMATRPASVIRTPFLYCHI
jgi:hypothetical protein